MSLKAGQWKISYKSAVPSSLQSPCSHSGLQGPFLFEKQGIYVIPFHSFSSRNLDLSNTKILIFADMGSGPMPMEKAYGARSRPLPDAEVRWEAVKPSSLRCRSVQKAWFRPPGHCRAPTNSTHGSSTARLFLTGTALQSETCGRSAPRLRRSVCEGHHKHQRRRYNILPEPAEPAYRASDYTIRIFYVNSRIISTLGGAGYDGAHAILFPHRGSGGIPGQVSFRLWVRDGKGSGKQPLRGAGRSLATAFPFIGREGRIVPRRTEPQ